MSRALTYAASLDEVFQLAGDRAADLIAAKTSLLLVADGDGFVRSHGGSIAVTSSASDGTTFRVHLPRVAGPAAR